MRCVQTRRVWLPPRDQSCVSSFLGCERATCAQITITLHEFEYVYIYTIHSSTLFALCLVCTV